jgi:hypothetical protein
MAESASCQAQGTNETSKKEDWGTKGKMPGIPVPLQY